MLLRETLTRVVWDVARKRVEPPLACVASHRSGWSTRAELAHAGETLEPGRAAHYLVVLALRQTSVVTVWSGEATAATAAVLTEVRLSVTVSSVRCAARRGRARERSGCSVRSRRTRARADAGRSR